jgi:glycosidase
MRLSSGFVLAGLLGLAPASLAACADGDDDLPTGAVGVGGGVTSSGSAPQGTGTGIGGAGGAGGAGAGSGQGGEAGQGGGGEGGGYTGLCPVEIAFEAGGPATNARVAGEWNGFDLATATPMSGPSADGTFTATLELQPGLHAYKVVFEDGGGATQWVLNPTEGRRKYLDGTENSAIKVRDCSLPTLDVASSAIERPSAGQGSFAATLRYVDGVDGSGADAEGFEIALRGGDGEIELSGDDVQVDAAGDVTVSIAGLEDGKYTLVLQPRSLGGHTGELLRLPFWIEAEPFSWEDALVYMVVTDRFKNGDPGNDPGPTPSADPRGDWFGGDFEGLRQEIAAGTLDELGIRAIWMTPFQTNPDDAYFASDGVHQVTGYHGYWPTKAREVDPRLGGEAGLRALVKEAHAHGIRILQDYVINHVHEDHEYVAEHPEWFRTGCVCGTQDCDWTSHALDCLFTGYLPDINHGVPAANKQFVDDAMWWLDEFDLDGLRVDAVKHVEEVATRNIAADVREMFEGAGTSYFLMGETAMGWSDCDDPCNDENYGTIAKYVGPHGLDGQFDFVLYHGVSYRTFAYGDTGMLHADYWVRHGLEKWPEGAIMTPYIGSHDTTRFASMADYRGQDGSHDRGIPGNQWENTAEAPSDGEPYRRTRLGMAWLLGLPGAPLLYYGDEYGQWGGADPNNRYEWRNGGDLTADEAGTLAFVRRLGRARQDLVALRRGAYVSLFATEDTLVFGRRVPGGPAALVALTRSGSSVPVSVEVGAALGWSSGTDVEDAMGGPGATVGGDGMLTFSVPAGGSVILHP